MTFRNRLTYALQKAGLYPILDRARDYAELATAGSQKTFSQFKEDLFLTKYFGGRKGLYIDVGGNHPFRLSNTYLLYRTGWSGLVVEPIRRLHDKHKHFRPRDIQINAVAGESGGSLTFFELLPSVLSTCEESAAIASLATQQAKLLSRQQVPVVTLAELYHKYLSPHPVSLLSIDTEGHDISVLRGVDWNSMSPEIIVCEANDASAGAELELFLSERGYRVAESLGCNKIFWRSQA